MGLTPEHRRQGWDRHHGLAVICFRRRLIATWENWSGLSSSPEDWDLPTGLTARPATAVVPRTLISICPTQWEVPAEPKGRAVALPPKLLGFVDGGRTGERLPLLHPTHSPFVHESSPDHSSPDVSPPVLHPFPPTLCLPEAVVHTGAAPSQRSLNVASCSRQIALPGRRHLGSFSSGVCEERVCTAAF